MTTTTEFKVPSREELNALNDNDLLQKIGELKTAFMAAGEMAVMTAINDAVSVALKIVGVRAEAVKAAAEKAAIEQKLPEVTASVLRAVEQAVGKAGITSGLTFTWNPAAADGAAKLTATVGASAPRAPRAPSGNGHAPTSGPFVVGTIRKGATEKYPSLKVGESYESAEALCGHLGLEKDTGGWVVALNKAGIYRKS